MKNAKPAARLFIESALAENAGPLLSASQRHYLLHALRMKAGETVALFNGRDGEWLARVVEAGKKNVTLIVENQLRPQAKGPDVWLAFAPVKNEKIDYTAKRAAELGVSALKPVLTQRTIVSRVNLERLKVNAAEAAEQCGRLDVPEVAAPEKLERLLSSWPKERVLIHCDESGKGKIARELLPKLKPGSYAVLIGPEGGFSPEERALIESRDFACGLNLGPRILRAETAALAALANVMAWAGDWNERPSFP